ncbi:MAG TPA: 5'-3' exonuclease H3TH domain-containing protein [Actinomycetota bacterium]|nr:5'-3' exonuclease H3TH domain-containing protein [Actinomycetota bacterium]
MARGGARAHVNIDRTVVPARPDALRGSSDVGLFDQLEPSLFLVDGNNLLWRAAHGNPAPFAATDGRDLTPLFRFIAKLRRVLGTYGLFAECVVCFDGAEAWAERVELDAQYKGNRRYENADLSFMGWLPEIRAALDCAGVSNLEIGDCEADDVIGTLAVRAGSRAVRILSTDRDYFQLISPTTTVVNPTARPALVDESELVARFGVMPRQWCDFRALAGDQSDGIPGLPGVGMTRAAALLAKGKTLEDLRETSPVAERWTDVCRWRELIRLRTDVPIDFEPSVKPTPRLPTASAVCVELGLV